MLLSVVLQRLVLKFWKKCFNISCWVHSMSATLKNKFVRINVYKFIPKQLKRIIELCSLLID